MTPFYQIAQKKAEKMFSEQEFVNNKALDLVIYGAKQSLTTEALPLLEALKEIETSGDTDVFKRSLRTAQEIAREARINFENIGE